MVVDLGFIGQKRALGPIAPRQKPVAVNFTGDAMKQHERVMELKNELSRTTADLQSALMSLSAANLEIDRLNSVVARLEADIRSKDEKAAKSQRSPRKRKDTSSSDEK